MLVRIRLVTVVGNVPLHVLVKSTETVPERGVFYSLFVSYHVIVKGSQTRYRIHDKVTVAWNRADRVCKQGQMHDARKGDQRLKVLPLANVVIVQVQELERFQTSENLATGQRLKLVVRQVDFLEFFK